MKYVKQDSDIQGRWNVCDESEAEAHAFDLPNGRAEIRILGPKPKTSNQFKSLPNGEQFNYELA